jgi:hypothetical protein
MTCISTQQLLLLAKFALVGNLKLFLQVCIISLGRSINNNSSLTSIPMYTIGFYWLYGIHQRFDSSRGKFFWEGVGNKKKFHMIKWEALDKPK